MVGGGGNISSVSVACRQGNGAALIYIYIYIHLINIYIMYTAYICIIVYAMGKFSNGSRKKTLSGH